MNNERRKRLKQAIRLLEEVSEIVTSCMEEEQEALDNLPESLQSSDMGFGLEDNVDTLQQAADGIDDVVSTLEDLA